MRIDDEEKRVKKRMGWAGVLGIWVLSVCVLAQAAQSTTQSAKAPPAKAPEGLWVSGYLPHSALAQLKGDVRIHNYALIASFINQTRDWKVEEMTVRLFLPKNRQALDLVLPITDRSGKPVALSPTMTGFARADLNFMPDPWYWKVLSAKGRVWVDKEHAAKEEKRWQFQY
jgi:hypothetical protein